MSRVMWANFGPASRIVAGAVRLLAPPVLIISLPRSGSSWLGKTLGISPSALYLREPVTQTHLRRHRRRGVVFKVGANEMPAGYAASAASAFSGVPAFPPNVVKYPEQWRISRRRDRRLVVKEVNPLALGWYAETWRPKIVYLLRHPAAVAASFARLGWINPEERSEVDQRFSAQRFGLDHFDHERFACSAWAEHAALQAMAMQSALDVLGRYGDHVVIRYEDLCADPVAQFRALYDFAGLEWEDKVERSILSQTGLEDHNRFESYSTFRNSRAMIDTWRKDVPEGALTELKDAFLHFEQPYYREAEW